MKKSGIIVTLSGIVLLAIGLIIIYIIDPSSFGLLYIGGSCQHLSIALIITGLALFFKGDWIKAHSRKKSTILSFLMSASAGICANCLLSVFFLKAFEENHLKHTVAIPANATLSLIAMIIFFALLVYYVVDCEKHAEIKTKGVDFLTVALYLFPFFYLSGTIIHLVSEPLKAMLNL